MPTRQLDTLTRSAGRQPPAALASALDMDAARITRVEQALPRFARIARMARHMFGARVVVICWTDVARPASDAEFIGFVDPVTSNASVLSRELARVYPELFSKELAVVRDTWTHAGMTDEKIVIAGQEMRSCATSAIHASDGFRIGTLCVLDTQPRAWEPPELESLADLSAQIEQQLELETVSRRLDAVRATQAALDESRARFQDLANASDEVFWVTDIDSGAVLYVSPAYERVWKRSVASLLENSDSWVEPIHPDDRELTEQAYQAGLVAQRAFEVEFRIVLPDGSVRHVLNRGFPVYAGDGQLIRMAGVASDITELHRAREELRMLAETDELTGALNSRAFRRLLRHELTRSVRERRPLAVALLDIDNFKAVNDEHGHLAGDAVLTQVVRILCGRLRASDIVARLGGDEFCLVLPNADEEGAASVLEELACEVARVRVPLHSGQSAAVTLSVGIAISNPASDEGELLKRADDALYVSKRDGRNRVSVAPLRRAAPG